jgi:hypothetical protein
MDLHPNGMGMTKVYFECLRQPRYILGKLPFDRLRVTVLFNGGGNATSRVTGVNNIQYSTEVTQYSK